jgi:hypothetical protein
MWPKWSQTKCHNSCTVTKNHLNSWGPIFMDCLVFMGSWWRYFMDLYICKKDNSGIALFVEDWDLPTNSSKIEPLRILMIPLNCFCLISREKCRFN